jgi:hypothetical protein
MPVTLSAPTCSRTCSAPANIRTYASFSPAEPRSTLNTVPAAGPSTGGSGGGSSVVIPPISSAIPAPVMAEPKNTGCTSAARICRRSTGAGSAGRFSTYAASSVSSCSASSSSAGRSPVTRAARVPASVVSCHPAPGAAARQPISPRSVHPASRLVQMISR